MGAAAAPQWFPGASHRAGLDRNLLDEASHLDQAGDQARKRILDESGVSHTARQVSNSRTLHLAGNGSEHADHRDRRELLITNPADGANLKMGPVAICGIAWDGGYGISTVEVSSDGGKTWVTATLGEDLGR